MSSVKTEAIGELDRGLNGEGDFAYKLKAVGVIGLAGVAIGAYKLLQNESFREKAGEAIYAKIDNFFGLDEL